MIYNDLIWMINESNEWSNDLIWMINESNEWSNDLIWMINETNEWSNDLISMINESNVWSNDLIWLIIESKKKYFSTDNVSKENIAYFTPLLVMLVHFSVSCGNLNFFFCHYNINYNRW